MSTLSTTNLKNPSSGSNNIVLGTDGSTRVSTIADSAGANTSTPEEIASGRAKAWVNFNGTGTVAIRASYNVSSITDNGTGSYTVNLTTATADANGSAIVTTWRNTTSTPDQSMQTQAYQSDVSTVDIRTYNTASTATDHGYINVALFR